MEFITSLGLSRKQFFFILLGALVAVSFLVLAFDWYPIAFVNGKPVFAYRFSRNYQAASMYYENALKTYVAPEDRPKELSREELQAGVLSQLVESLIVSQAAYEEVGDELDYLVESKVNQYLEDEALGEAAEALYGLSQKEFVLEVLIPQAKRDILAGRLFLDGKALEEWLDSKRKEARVRILSGQFEWNGGEVVVKK